MRPLVSSQKSINFNLQTMAKKKVDKIKLSDFSKGLFTNSRRFLRFMLFSGSFVLIGFSVMQISRVFLRTDIVPDVTSPVSRFVASVDFDERTVELDSTISKSYSSPIDISIWRFGDGEVIKSADKSEISDNEVITHVFDEPGTYTVGYSIIDEDDLSDEALCTITFEDPDADPSENSEYGTENEDWISSDCGKSYVEYNSWETITNINANKQTIRHSILFIIGSILVILYTVFFLRDKKEK